MTLFQVFARALSNRIHLCPPFNYVGRGRESACHTVFAQDGRARGVHLARVHRAARVSAHCFGPVLIEAITAAAPARMQRNCVGSPCMCVIILLFSCLWGWAALRQNIMKRCSGGDGDV